MVSTVRSTPFLMSSKWFGSTETVGSSTKRRNSDSYSSRCELAKDKRLSRFNVVDIQILRRTVLRELARHNKANRSDTTSALHSTRDCALNGISRATNPRNAASTCLRRFCIKLRPSPRVHSKGSVLRVILASPCSDWTRPGLVRTRDYQVFVLGGLREKKVFCPGNTLPRFCPGSSRVHYRPAK